LLGQGGRDERIVMQLYRLESTAPARGDLIDIADPDQRLWKSLVMGESSEPLERALQHGAVLTAEAQDRYRPRMLAKADYLSAVVPLPLFSDRLMSVLAGLNPNGRAYPVTVNCRGKQFPFFIYRLDERRDLMDEEASTWRVSSTGAKFPLNMVFRGNAADDFLLARDRTYPNMILASQRFVDACAAAKLNIAFTPAPMSS
jgi:hypothetical protein